MLNVKHFPHCPSLSLFSFFLVLRSVCLLRVATAMESQFTGLKPIIRKENGMNRKASFHWEMPKYRHIMDTEAEVEGCRDINWSAVGHGILWSHSGSPRMMAGRRYTALTVSSQLQACIDKQRFYVFLWLQMHKHVNNCMSRDWGCHGLSNMQSFSFPKPNFMKFLECCAHFTNKDIINYCHIDLTWQKKAQMCIRSRRFVFPPSGKSFVITFFLKGPNWLECEWNWSCAKHIQTSLVTLFNLRLNQFATAQGL